MASSLQEILPNACIKAGIERDRGCGSYTGGGIGATERAERGDGGGAAGGDLPVRDGISAASRHSPPIYLPFCRKSEVEEVNLVA